MPRDMEIDCTTVPVATEEELLDFANRVREAGGADILNALLPSVPNDARSCLIARALNFDCIVKPIFSSERARHDLPEYQSNHSMCWVMEAEEDIISKLREALNLPAIRIGPYKNLVLVLPEHIGNAALAFDEEEAFAHLITGT